jgi:hypothetical protein
MPNRKAYFSRAFDGRAQPDGMSRSFLAELDARAGNRFTDRILRPHDNRTIRACQKSKKAPRGLGDWRRLWND